MEKVLEQLLGNLLTVARAFRYPFQYGTFIIHVERGVFVRYEANISVK